MLLWKLDLIFTDGLLVPDKLVYRLVLRHRHTYKDIDHCKFAVIKWVNYSK